MTAEQEILQQEEQLANARRTLDLDALQRIYADDLVMTGVLGEPTCGKPAIIDEAKRGITERQAATASGRHVEASAENQDMKVTAHGNTAIASYRFVVRIKSQSTDVLRRYRTTNVWMKRDGEWQIIAGHMAFIMNANQAACSRAKRDRNERSIWYRIGRQRRLQLQRCIAGNFIRLVVIGAIAFTAHAQWLNYPTPGIPRTADRKPNLTAPAPRTGDGRPDLTGLWTGFTGVADLKLDDAQPWARALVQQRKDNFNRDNPYYQCLPQGPGLTAADFAALRRIVQTPAMIAILYDDLTYRQIFMDGRKLETDPYPSWMGYSVGRWEGDTLVVDSAGLNDRTWLNGNYPHTEALRMTERYRRIDFGHLQIEATLQDPGAFSRPWTVRVLAQLAADREMGDVRCDPAETGREHWTGTISGAQRSAVKVAPEILAKYVGVYKGVLGWRPWVVEMTLSGDALFVSFPGVREEPQRLVPSSESTFSSDFGYTFIRDKQGMATEVVEMHVAENITLHREK